MKQGLGNIKKIGQNIRRSSTRIPAADQKPHIVRQNFKLLFHQRSFITNQTLTNYRKEINTHASVLSTSTFTLFPSPAALQRWNLIHSESTPHFDFHFLFRLFWDYLIRFHWKGGIDSYSPDFWLFVFKLGKQGLGGFLSCVELNSAGVEFVKRCSWFVGFLFIKLIDNDKLIAVEIIIILK